MTLAELRSALATAQRRMVDAYDKIEAARPDDEKLDAYKREFDDAETEVTTLKERITRAASVESTNADLAAARERETADEEARARAAADAEQRARAEAEQRAAETREALVREAREAAVAEI